MLAPAVGRLGIQQGCSQIGLGEWKSLLLSLCISSIPATMDTFLMTPLGNDRGNWVIESDHQGKLVFLEKQSLSLKPLREEGLNKEAVRKKKKKRKKQIGNPNIAIKG